MRKLISFKTFFTNINTTFKRFPIVLLFSFFCFILYLIEQRGGMDGIEIHHEKYRIIKALLECTSGIALYFSIDIFCEQNNINKNTRIGLYLLSFCVLGLHYYSTPGEVTFFDAFLIYRYSLFIICFHLLVSFAAFYKVKDINAYWQYNLFLFIRLLTAIFFSICLFVGIGCCMLAVEKLFEIKLPYNSYSNLAAFIFFTFNTFYFLSGIPQPISIFKTQDLFNKSIRVFTQYILIPIVTLYGIILYAYSLKVVFESKLPVGYVCIPILIFSILGLLAYLLIYTIRDKKEYLIIYYFSKIFFYSLLPLLMLYFISIYYRIKPYGITEERYLILLLGTWLTLLSLYIIFSKRDNIIFLPISLFILLGLSIIGPWSMFNISALNQYARLKRILKYNHVLVDKKYLHENAMLLSKEEKDNASSILRYLYMGNNIKIIEPLLNDDDQKSLASLIKNKKDVSTIQSLLGFSNDNAIQKNANTMYVFAKQNWLQQYPIELTKNTKLIQAECINNQFYTNATINTDSTIYTGNIQNLILTIYKGKDTLMKEDLFTFIQPLFNVLVIKDTLQKNSLLATKINEITPLSYSRSIKNDSMIYNLESKCNGKMYISNVEINYIDTTFTVTKMNLYISFE